MASFSFTDHAEHDLIEIIDYTNETWGVNQATKYIDALYVQAQLLSDNPDIGQKRSQLVEGLLSFPFGSHIIFYFKSVKGIIVARVLHQKMDLVRHSFE